MVLVVGTVLCCNFLVTSGVAPEVGVVVWLPDEYKDMVAEKVAVSDAETKWLPEDTTTYKKRYISNELSDQLKYSNLKESDSEYYKSINSINATLIVAGSDSRSLHNPVVCLRSQAWDIYKQKVDKIETSGGDLEVMSLYLKRTILDANREAIKDKNGEDLIQKAIYTYWWIGPDDVTPYIETRILLSLVNSIKKRANERWAYPSFMTFAKGSEDSDLMEAKDRLYTFIKDVAPVFQKSLGAVSHADEIPTN